MANSLSAETNHAALNNGVLRTRRTLSRRRRKGAHGGEPLRVVIVGASLSGLMTALAITLLRSRVTNWTEELERTEL